jgi:Cyclic nucleotide-binding domain
VTGLRRTTLRDAVSRYLVVLDQTLGGERLVAAAHERAGGAGTRFHILVPARPRPGRLTWSESEAELLAHDRLERAVSRFRQEGLRADGSVGDPDPLQAVGDALMADRFDEIIVSTSPPGTHGRRGDLPRQIRERSGLRTTSVAGPPELETKGEALNAVPMFSGLSQRRLRRLVTASVTREYRAGETIVEAGSQRSDLYVILEGRVRVRRARRIVAHMRSGEVFGEISLLDNGPRTADVIAEAPTRCVRLAGADFRSALQDDPRLALAVLEHTGRRLRELTDPPGD